MKLSLLGAGHIEARGPGSGLIRPIGMTGLDCIAVNVVPLSFGYLMWSIDLELLSENLRVSVSHCSSSLSMSRQCLERSSMSWSTMMREDNSRNHPFAVPITKILRDLDIAYG